MDSEKGSITAYISLVLVIILALFLQSMSAVRFFHAREMTACAMQQGLYSLWAQYDRTLLKEYELLFIDGGFGTDQYRPDLMQKTVCDYANEMLDSSHSGLFSAGNLSGGIASDVSWTSLSLATDHQGTAFQRQVIEAMKENLGPAGAQLLIQRFSAKDTASTNTERESKKAVTDYKNAKDTARSEEEKKVNSETEGSEETEKVKVPENFKNPIEVISELMSQGILALVLPEDCEIPGGRVTESELLHNRSRNTGFGGICVEHESSDVEKSLLCAYGMWKFDSFTDRSSYPGLNLQQEYLLEGQSSDAENLKRVLNALLALREAENLAYLWSDPIRVEEMTSMSNLIVAAIGLPVALPVVMHALAACWAFAESLAELRTLLAGKKIALLPSRSTWRISLENLADFTGKSGTETQTAGLGYEEFLSILMMTRKTEQLTERMMDLVEQNMRNRYGKPYFHLDYCVDEGEATMNVKFPSGVYSITRSYGYEEKR